MEEQEIILPKLGESIVSAVVVQWFKKVGDQIKLDEPLLEVSTDKINSEIPSSVAGTLKEILVKPDEEIEVGKALAIISTAKKAVSALQEKVKAPHAAIEPSSKKRFYSPAVLHFAREKGIDLETLEKIPGRGSQGRLMKRDLEAFLETHGGKESPKGEIERLKMTGMRKAIADNLVRSFYEAPHATVISEVDVTSLMRFIKKEKEGFLKKHGFKLTITSFIAKAIAKAAQEYPLINSSLDDDTIVLKRFVNLGIAVSIEKGLLVPVICQVHSRTLVDIAKEVAELAEKARTGKLSPDDVKGGSITMTNFGMSGILIGIPIIRHPEVAIVGIGAIHRKVVALDDETMAIRSMMHISLTFDHRVLDGMYACNYLNALKKHLEEKPTSIHQ